jgi:hypothetical protein
VKAYHGTKQLRAALREGLVVPPYNGVGCRIGHVCLTDIPAIAAWVAERGDDPGIVEVDLDGLELPEEGFVGHEMRLHHNVEPRRLTVFTTRVRPSREGHIDPAHMPGGNHPTCLRLLREAREAGRI